MQVTATGNAPVSFGIDRPQRSNSVEAQASGADTNRSQQFNARNNQAPAVEVQTARAVSESPATAEINQSAQEIISGGAGAERGSRLDISV